MTRPTYHFFVCALAVLFLGLMTIHLAGPWQFRHEDNGAWFSAVARTHLRAGLAATRGQDFFQERATGQLKPYLHHPPLLGLYLAGVFKLVGSDSQAVARAAMMAVHFCSFLVFALLVSQVFPASNWARLWALMVFAISPMSVYFGRTPSHEPLGLLFVLVGACVSFMVAGAHWRRKAWLYVAGAAWMLAAFAAWHAIFCIVGFIPYLLRLRKNSAPGYARVALLTALGATALVGLHLVWANHGHLEANALPAAFHWTGMASAGSWPALLVHAMTNVALYTVEFFGYAPPLLAAVWLVGIVRARMHGRRLADRDLFVLSLCLGSWAFGLLLIRAVSAHVYHQFYLLPPIALSSAIVIEGLLSGAVLRRHRKTALVAVAVAALLTVAGCAAILASVYHKPYGYAVNAARGIEQRFY